MEGSTSARGNCTISEDTAQSHAAGALIRAKPVAVRQETAWVLATRPPALKGTECRRNVARRCLQGKFPSEAKKDAKGTSTPTQLAQRTGGEKRI